MRARIVQLRFIASFFLLASIHLTSAANDVNATKISPHIINGVVVTTSTFPWHAVLAVGSRFCGGSLIHTSWILTAAHCLVGSSGLTARLGSLMCQSGGITISVPSSAYYINANFNPSTSANDIALVKLPSSPPIVLSSTLNIVKLYPRAKCCPTIFNSLVFSGCGTINGPAMPTNLRSTSLTDMTDLACMTSPFANLPVGSMCTISATSNTCLDDDGGALVLSGAIPYQVGVLALSSNSCTSSAVNTRSIFIRVCMYHDWIQKTTGIDLG